MAASKDLSLVFELGDYADRPLAASSKVYRHTALGQVAGTNTYRALVAGDKFAGITLDGCDNSAGAAGAAFVRTRVQGKVLLTVAGASAATAVGASVYASADDTYTTTSSGNSLVGKVVGWDAATSKCVVEFNAATV